MITTSNIGLKILTYNSIIILHSKIDIFCWLSLCCYFFLPVEAHEVFYAFSSSWRCTKTHRFILIQFKFDRWAEFQISLWQISWHWISTFYFHRCFLAIIFLSWFRIIAVKFIRRICWWKRVQIQVLITFLLYFVFPFGLKLL